MRESRPKLFRGRHFRDEVIVLCVRWYLRYPLSYRNLEEMMAERGLAVDHSTIARWVLTYAPLLNERIRSERRHSGRSWRTMKLMCESQASGPTYIERSTQLVTRSIFCYRQSVTGLQPKGFSSLPCGKRASSAPE